ncbi:hypothetical protein [Sandaracinobacteroides saxicola]|uniref:Nitroreductase domain-containing protein n=1 Tax=Sandaracinobacteroides saxicola TaxID=2759707 RepID=A0A7G5IIT7_9SPHN|nr:hypothetical protein [Sandaracinobacteroides saxicola]QMW23279.1 hypothetical protein H3309_01845 [Sandaracinobacteroides saxicola]
MNRLAVSAPERDRLGAMEVFALTGYQRLERLDVPVFGHDTDPIAPSTRMRRARLYRLSTDLPAEISTLADHVGGTPCASVTGLRPDERVALLLRYLAAPMRFEPLGESAIHRAVPSARGLFPLRWSLRHLSPDGTRREWVYHGDWHALRPTDDDMHPDDAPAMHASGWALLCVAEVWRIAGKYGDFSDVPCALEAGHGFAQAGHLARALGLLPAEEPARAMSGFTGSGRAAALELPLFALPLRLDGFDVHDLPALETVIAEAVAPPALAERFPTLAALHRCFDAPPAAPGLPASSTAQAITPPSIGLLGTMRVRTAGNDRSGIAATLAPLRPDLAADIDGLWRGLRAVRPRGAAEAMLRFTLYWASYRGGPALCDTSGAIIEQGIALPLKLGAMLPYGGMRVNLATATAILFVAVDPRAAVAQLGDASLRESHLAAGAAAHDFALACAAYGLFARPMRMMREAALEAVLPVGGLPLYLVVAGFARRANPTGELL